MSLPDIDIDFCVRGRGDVINPRRRAVRPRLRLPDHHLWNARFEGRDQGRRPGARVPYAEVERIAKLIPPPVRGRNVSLSQALEQVPELRKEGNQPRLKKYLRSRSKAVRGTRRSRRGCGHLAAAASGTDPAAVSGKEELTTQYVMSDLEKTGMLKMDFLALTALTVINDCLMSIKQLR